MQRSGTVIRRDARHAVRPIGTPIRAPHPPKSATPPRERRIPVLAGVLLAVLLLGSAAGWTRLQSWRSRRALAAAEHQLVALAPELVAEQVRRLAADPRQGSQTLARLLASPREAVALAAGRELDVRLAEIEAHRDLAGGAALAAALSRSLPAYGPSSRHAARAACVRLLTLAGEGQGELLDLCETVLRRTETLPAESRPIETALLIDDGTPRAGPFVLDEPWPELMHLPGGGLPADDVTVPRLPRSLADRAPRATVEATPPRDAVIAAPADEPRRLPEPRGERALQPGDVEMRLIDPRAEPEPESEPLAAQSIEPSAPRWEAVPSDSSKVAPSPTAVLPKAWSEMSESQLLDALREGSGNAPTIEAELRRMGFEDRHLALARHLTSPRVAERLEWTGRLPSLPEIEADAWLAWLCRDPAPEVRWSAVTLLATADRARAEPILREMSHHDPDVPLRQQAARQLTVLGAASR